MMEEVAAETFDAFAAGAGVIGASTAFHMAKLGGQKVCVVKRGRVCSSGTARSYAIVRSYYSVATNTLQTVRSVEKFGRFKVGLDRLTSSGPSPFR